MSKKEKKEPVWVIAYINREFIDKAKTELVEYGYDNVEAYIPTIRVLKKNSKGKRLFELVPLLFNYGFFKMPFEMATNTEALMELRSRISCIYGWVRDLAYIDKSTPNLKADNSNFTEAKPRYAIATDKEVARLVKQQKSMSIYSEKDLQMFKAGDLIQLEGYPFSGIPAEIVSINFRKKEVKVKLLIDAIVKEMTVSFENVFYSIYKDFEEKSKEISLDELTERYGPNTMDSLIMKNKK